MRRRYIAVKASPEKWGFVVATGDHTESRLLKAGFFERDPQRPLADQLAEVFEPLQMTDRLALTLPGQGSLIRWLEFPFKEARKIAAAVLPEINSRLPENPGQRVVFHQIQETGKVLTVAVSKETIESCLAQFDDNREPVGYLGITPLCYLPGLDWPVNSLLLTIEADGICLARVEAGDLTDLRFLPQTLLEAEDEIIQQAQLLARCGSPLMRLRTAGVATESPLAIALKAAGFELDPIRFDAEGKPVPNDLITLAALAMSAVHSSPQQINLRSGPYKLKNDWQVIKRRASIAVGLLLTTLIIFAGSAYLQGQQRTSELEGLQQQMKTFYLKQFPEDKVRIAPALQMQSKLKELQKKVAQYGSDTGSALKLLLAVSQHMDQAISVDIREYVQNDEGLRLSGSTTSFDAVSRLLSDLQKEPLFKEVRVMDSKQAIDGSRVDFQIQILLQQSKGK
ncbi:type II secretion system protein GspL [Geopsychrobacter electrodiphilus]|uniref:type II secretion system protein GspL n=1 Tax=Geopsychrobacter electrodiphilus TaxID=225196 RepID=UPI000368F716|nr:type II secretion system protein GspL [Geopsychrobacter electrodiphilus]